MPYDPDAHRCLDALSTKYGSWLSQVRSDGETEQPIFDADGNESSLSECYQDALVTAHALFAYLVEHPPVSEAPRQPEVVPRPFLRAVASEVGAS